MRRLFLLPLDLLLVALSLALAYGVRFDGSLPADVATPLRVGLVAAVAVKPAVFLASGFYRRLWEYASIQDALHTVKTVSLACLITAGLTLLFFDVPGHYKSVLAIDWVFLSALILGRSLAWRLVREHRRSRRQGALRPILVVGAGMAGRMLLKEINHNSTLRWSVVGFLDDDPDKIGALVHDVPVLGPIHRLRAIARRHGVRNVIISIPSAPAELIREVIHLCQGTGIDVQRLPAMAEILNANLLAPQIRSVKLEDLLRRDPVALDEKKIGSRLAGRAVLVTGAGGSIGSEICRQVAHYQPSRLILFETAETPLYQIALELERHIPRERLLPVLGDVRDRAQVERLFADTRPDVVFHAAAYKHVPMMEHHPMEAVKTNVFGTLNLAEAAEEAGVERFVMISTDKAVNPTNVMGATKRVAEMLIQDYDDRARTEFVTVRFGNVLGSNGSVVPLFQDQIRRGGPVTVTHPDVIRYFMTIPEAAQLVLQAGSMGVGGEIFLLDMGEPVRILDLAEELIRLSGLVPRKDIDIVFTGLRPGEKLFEELLIDGEGVKPTGHGKVLVAAARKAEQSSLEALVRELRMCLRADDGELVVQALQRAVSEYRPAGRAKVLPVAPPSPARRKDARQVGFALAQAEPAR